MSAGENYTGADSLENLKEAVNYNNFLEEELMNFIAQSRTVLDFGAGNGEFARRLNSDEINVDCLEIDPNFSAALKTEGFKVFSSLSEITGTYEKIYSLNVLEHIEDDISALKTLHNLLATDGKIFIYVPAFMLLYSSFDKKIGHFRRYTKRQLSQRLKAGGFHITRAEYADSAGFFAWLTLKLIGKDGGEPNRKMIKFYDKWLFPISRFFDIFFNRIFGKNLLIIAEKA